MKLAYQIITQDSMHHISSSNLHVNDCYIYAKSVISKLMLFYFELMEKYCWNGLGVSLDHVVRAGSQPTTKVSQNCITSQNR